MVPTFPVARKRNVKSIQSQNLKAGLVMAVEFCCFEQQLQMQWDPLIWKRKPKLIETDSNSFLVFEQGFSSKPNLDIMNAIVGMYHIDPLKSPQNSIRNSYLVSICQPLHCREGVRVSCVYNIYIYIYYKLYNPAKTKKVIKSIKPNTHILTNWSTFGSARGRPRYVEVSSEEEPELFFKESAKQQGGLTIVVGDDFLIFRKGKFLHVFTFPQRRENL